MTSIQSVLAAFAIILTDLFGRAGLDKVLALTGGPTTVALWAQQQTVVKPVSTVAMAGVLQGLAVLIAQAHDPRDERNLLRAALLYLASYLVYLAFTTASLRYSVRKTSNVRVD